MKPTAPSSTSTDLAAVVRAGATGLHPRRKLYLAVAGGVLLLALGYGCRQRAEAARLAPSFVTAPVTRGDLTLTITATGNLEPTNEVTIGSELSGTIAAVFVDSNDRVTQGQPLAQLDTSKLEKQILSYRAAVDSAKANVAQAEATLAEAESALTRQQELQRLSGGKMPSKADLDAAVATAARARADLASARAAVSQTEATLASNERDLAKAIIRSPTDGIVLTRSVEPGQTVAASLSAPELFVIAESLEHMKLEVTIAEADIGRVAVGQSSTFTVDAWPDRAYSAKVTKVAFGSSTTDNVVTYATELEVENTDLSLRPGMTATAEITVAARAGVLTVPAAALRYTPAAPAASSAEKKSFLQSIMPMPPRPSAAKRPASTETARPAGTGRVWTVSGEEAPRPLELKVGLSDGRRTEVSGEGLGEGLAVITNSLTPAP
ncbi:MAG: efflux RND transporter periplasmic adaptor subunit [Opitutaceae bacterium]